MSIHTVGKLPTASGTNLLGLVFKMIHFELSQRDGDCCRRAIEVERWKGLLLERGLQGGGNKEAAGDYRSRSVEEGPDRKRAAGVGGSRRK